MKRPVIDLVFLEILGCVYPIEYHCAVCLRVWMSCEGVVANLG